MKYYITIIFLLLVFAFSMRAQTTREIIENMAPTKSSYLPECDCLQAPAYRQSDIDRKAGLMPHIGWVNITEAFLTFNFGVVPYTELYYVNDEGLREMTSVSWVKVREVVRGSERDWLFSYGGYNYMITFTQ